MAGMVPLLCVLLLLVFAAPAVAQPPPPPLSIGSPACECIDPWAQNTSASVDESGCRNATLGYRHLGGPHGIDLCLPMTYGRSRCEAWDSHVGGVCVDQRGTALASGAPDWCASKWCYVDASTCERPHQPTNIAFHDPDAPLNLAYSYETCGNLDTYTGDAHFRTLRGKHLRVSYPADSDAGYSLYTDSHGIKQGSTVHFMQDVAADAGFTWSVHPVSEISSSKYLSTYTACVHEVALNQTDLCIGTFWINNERLLMSSFTRSLGEDHFRLIVPTEIKESDLMTSMVSPFLPFTPTAWTISAALVMFMAFALRVIEGDPDDENAESYDADLLEYVEYMARHPAQLLSNGQRLLCEGLVSMTNGFPSQEPSCFAGRLVTIGYAIFGIIFLTSFTASTAATMLVSTKQVAVLETLDDVLATGGNLCIKSSIASSFLLRYPSFGGKLLDAAHVEDLLEKMDAGECVATVAMTDAWDKIIAQDNIHCNKMLAGPTLMTRGFAIPVRDELAAPLSYVIQKHVTMGSYKTYSDESKKSHVGGPSCSAGQSTNNAGDSTDLLVMDERALLSPFLITFASTGVGLIWHFLDSLYGKLTSQMTKTERGMMKELEKLPLSALWDRAIKTQATKEELEAAVEYAPKRRALINLVFSKTCSEERKRLIDLQDKSLHALRSIAEEMGIDKEKMRACINNKDDPKRRLMKLIVASKTRSNTGANSGDRPASSTVMNPLQHKGE